MSNDITAFSYLYDKYAPGLYGIVLRLIPNVRVAECVLENSFVKIWRELKDHDVPEGKLSKIMLRITLQECITEGGFPKSILHQLLTKKEQSTLSLHANGFLNFVQNGKKF